MASPFPTESKSDIRLSVVLAAYNEQASVEKVIRDHIEVLCPANGMVDDWELICLDDASQDETPNILARLAKEYPRLRVIRHSSNKGIFESYRRLFYEATGSHIYMTSSDGQWPASILVQMLKEIRTSGADLVIGTRLNRHQVYSNWRLFISTIYNLLPRVVFGVKTCDAGSNKLGAKVIFQFDLISRSPFVEAERIIRAQREGYRIEFVPIEFVPRSGGKATGAKWSNIVASVRDCFRCMGRYGIFSKR